jgi:hypothetical protein
VPHFTDDLTASKAGIKKSDAAPVIDQVCEAADHFPTATRNMPLRLRPGATFPSGSSVRAKSSACARQPEVEDNNPSAACPGRRPITERETGPKIKNRAAIIGMT